MEKHNCRVCGCELIPGENWAPGNQKIHNCICKKCISQYGKQRYKEHGKEIRQHNKQYRKEHKEERRQHENQYKKEHREEIRQHNIKRKYGLSPKEYNTILEAQDNRCAICGKPFVDTRHTHVDHDHASGEVRAILCNNCNTILGHAHDDPEILLRAANYLKNAKQRG